MKMFVVDHLIFQIFLSVSLMQVFGDPLDTFIVIYYVSNLCLSLQVHLIIIIIKVQYNHCIVSISLF